MIPLTLGTSDKTCFSLRGEKKNNNSQVLKHQLRLTPPRSKPEKNTNNHSNDVASAALIPREFHEYEMKSNTPVQDRVALEVPLCDAVKGRPRLPMTACHFLLTGCQIGGNMLLKLASVKERHL